MYKTASSSKSKSLRGDSVGGDDDEEEAHKLLEDMDNRGCSTTEPGKLGKKASSSSSLTKQDSVGPSRSWKWSRSNSRNSGSRMGLSPSQSVRSDATASAPEDNDVSGSIDEMLIASPSFSAKEQGSR